MALPYTARAQRGLPVSSSILLADEAGLARRNVRHNAVALGADFALFLVGLAFASQSTILPAFAAHLGAPNVVIGAIPAVMTLGWFLPSLFAAGHTESLARKLPFVMRFTLWERVPFLALALIAFFVATPAPAVALAALLLVLLIVTGTGGVLMPAWMDIVSRAIPTTLRGRFFGVANVLGSAGGLVGSVGTAYFLARVPAPASYGICFLCAALCMGLSYVALALVREPATAAIVPPQPMRAYLRRIPALLARDRNLSWFLVARAFASIGTMAGGFYTVYALRAWEAPAWWVATFTSVLLAGQIAGNLVFGFLADRAGHRLVLISGTVIGSRGERPGAGRALRRSLFRRLRPVGHSDGGGQRIGIERHARVRARCGGAAHVYRPRDDPDGAGVLRGAPGGGRHGGSAWFSVGLFRGVGGRPHQSRHLHRLCA